MINNFRMLESSADTNKNKNKIDDSYSDDEDCIIFSPEKTIPKQKNVSIKLISMCPYGLP